jgi:hypothetical protein
VAVESLTIPLPVTRRVGSQTFLRQQAGLDAPSIVGALRRLMA